MRGRPTYLTYRDSGVDVSAGNRLVGDIAQIAHRTRRDGSLAGIGGFGALFDLAAAGYSDPVLVAATDGVGTKLRIAIETRRLDTIGIDLVAMCANDLVVQGAEPLFFLDYYATGQLDRSVAGQVIAGIAEGCRQAGAALIGGETAEMPGFYDESQFDLAGFAVGAVDRQSILPRRDIAAGDAVLGLASSGLHSNGFSLVHRIVGQTSLALSDPAPFAPGCSMGEALLTPTNIYVAECLAAHRECGGVKGFAHITGGGLTENIPRILPDSAAIRIDLDTIDVPPVIGWLAANGPVEETELLTTFNCGIGMVVVVEADRAEDIARTLAVSGRRVTPIGKIEPRSGDPVIYDGRLRLAG